ncbi:unnamed protein product [Schistocephalus solidus]|uniref:Ras-associating domain-containing protein n=1 Tax=Schistocephalus solidus TaxID=70667 RepID=A0A183SRW7_SCHSO|nr:unnamed protein product [Schistocephalus solidus]
MRKVSWSAELLSQLMDSVGRLLLKQLHAAVIFELAEAVCFTYSYVVTCKWCNRQAAATIASVAIKWPNVVQRVRLFDEWRGINRDLISFRPRIHLISGVIMAKKEKKPKEKKPKKEKSKKDKGKRKDDEKHDQTRSVTKRVAVCGDEDTVRKVVSQVMSAAKSKSTNAYLMVAAVGLEYRGSNERTLVPNQDLKSLAAANGAVCTELISSDANAMADGILSLFIRKNPQSVRQNANNPKEEDTTGRNEKKKKKDKKGKKEKKPKKEKKSKKNKK